MGYVYILANKNYLDGKLLKIGMTTRTVEKRLSEINSAFGVPPKFYIVFYEKTKNPDVAEKIIHSKLKRFRVNNRKEFFLLPEKDAVNTVKHVCNMLLPFGNKNPPMYQKIALFAMVFVFFMG